MDNREERQKQADAAFRSSGFGMPKIAPSPIQQEADAAASLVNAKPVAPPPTLWEQVRDSEIGRSYFWGKEDYSRRAKEIADRLQVSPDVVSIAGEESLKRWENTFQTLEMGKRDDEFAQTWSDWNDISQTERAIRVHNYSDVKQTMGVVDNVMSGIRQMDAQIKLSAMGNERMELDAKGANTDELDAKIQNLQKYIMSQSGDGGIIHDTSSQLYMMANQSVNSGKEIMIGSLMGAAAGAAAGGVGAIPGFITGAGLGYRAGLFNRMNEMERGLSYLEYRSGGEYGKMSAETAAKAATAVGITNAAIEFASFGMGLRALSMGARKIAGRTAATGAQSIIRNAARSIASARSVGEAGKIFAKSAGIGVASETAEEVAQQAVQDVAWNVAADPGEGTRKMPVTEIISNAVDAGITAAPTILGMSAVLGTGANIRFVSKAARMLRPDYEIQKEMAVHTVGAQMLRDLEADKQTSALFKKDPELYTKSVQEAADKQGLGAFFVDANALMETEGGRDILNRMVSGNVVSEQALQTAIETEGRLEIPVGVYLQEDFTEQQRAAVDKASAWTQDGTTQAEMAAHWENMAASKYAQELQDDIDRMIHATDRVLSDKFSAADEADKETIRQVLMTNPLDLESARKKVRKEIEDNIEQTFSDTISVMRSNLADGGVHLIPGRDTVYDQDRMLRASSNPQWYKDFYATHKRKPRKDEFYDIMLDEEEKQVQRYYSNGVIKSEQDYEDALQQIENGRKMVEALRTIDAHKDTFDELQKEKAVSLRMYLSPDEMKVYDDVKKFMDNVGGDAQESAHQAAYLWAKRAKVFTQMMHDMGHTDFVATDYLDMHPLFTMNEYTPDAADKMAAQYLQQNKTVTFVTEEERAEFEREGERFIAVLNDDAVPNSEMIRLTAAPEILTALGYTNEDIVISKGLALNTMNAPGTSAHAHAMTSKMLAQIPAALHEPVFVLKSATRKHDSIVVFTDIRDEQDQSVIVPIRFTKNKLGYANQISSMYPRTREELFMLKQIMSDNLVYISTRKGPLWAKSTRLQLPRTLLKESLNYELKIARKKGDVKHYRGNYYFQAAWHGSHHSFGRFDTNAIGTGTGRQAHGWGLYFTQSQGAARQYRDQLVSRESVRRRKTDGSYGQYLIFENGKPIDAAAQEAINRRIAAKTLKTVANGRPEETYFLPELKQVMQQLKEGDASTNRLIHVLREQIDTIKSNNKMSITAFLRQVPTDEKARIRAIVRETKAAANNEGRRTTIADVLEGIERHAKPLISQRERELADWRALSGLKVNALTVAAPGSLYKVDIPENEVLLDEDTPLNEQPEAVRKAIAAYYQSRPDSYIAVPADGLGASTGEYFLRDVVFQMQREGEEEPKKAASLLLRKFGIEGITYKDNRDGRCFVVFNDQAVRVLERNGQAVGEMYQDGKTEAQGRPLVALHNTTAEKIRHIAELGGIAVPSIAITRADVPYNRFGDITLIAGADFINPQKKENTTFDTDVYSPRYPQVYDYKLEKGAEKELVSVFAPLVKKFSGEDIGAGALADLKKSLTGGLDGVLSKGGLDENETAQKAWFATKGLTVKDLPNTEARYKYWIDNHSEFKEWLAPLYHAIPKQARILTGYTASGRQRFKDYTLDNIVKIMRGKARNEEGMYYGVGNIRAAHAKKYKNLTEVQNDRNRITSHEDMETWKEKLNEKWESLTQKAGGAKAEILADIVLNSPKSKWQNELDKENITGINANTLSDFVNDITSAPAEYFEVKKQRAVGLDEFYAAIVPKGTTRETRKILRDAGLRVVTYDGKNRNEVLLKTAQQLQKKHGDVLFQRQQERHIRGMTALRDGRQMLFLFRKDANFSTFVHESGHVFLEDLQQMAAQDNAPEWLKKDWQTVKEWTGWKDGADNRAAHEKWARGFEAYVREGNAPSRDLKAVFRRFRRWLVGIYQNLLDLGEIPPESIRNVMDRMLATQEEIDAYTAEKALDTMQDVDTKLAARLAKLKARAAEKVEKDVEAKIRKGVEEVLEDAVESWRTARTEELRKEEIYKHEALAKQFGEDVLNKYYADAAAFKKALEDAGGPLEERLKREEQEQRKAFADELMNPESIRTQVEEYMTGELGQADLLEAETRYIARERNKLAGEYMKQLRKLDSHQQTDEQTEAERLAEVLSYLRSELKEHEGARESVKDAQKQLSKMRQQERAAEQELEREQTLVARLKESHAEDAEEHAQKLAEMRQKLTDIRKENAAKVQAIKKTAREEINTRLQGLRDVRDSTQGRLRLIEEQAAQTLRQAPIGESLTWKTYQRKIAYYGTLSSKALVRGDYAQAAEMKERQLYHAYLAKHAVMQEQQVDKDIRRLRENLKRMTRSQQPIRLDTQSRYFVHHLMYQLGLTGTDAQAPIDGFEMSSIEELLNPDVAFGMGGDPVISPALRAMFEADGRNEKTWRQMPFETWEQTVQVLQAVYTAGRRMHDGLAIVRKNGEHVSIADAANELALKLKKRYGEDNRDLRQIRNDMTRADRMEQLAGELVTQLIKPEIIMNRLDGRAVGVKIDDDSFHRFIYDPIARAANRKREMTADAKRTLSRIFERRYSRNEMRTMRQERKYQVGNRRAYTKEEILTAALNWGAAENRKRVLHTFGVDEMTMNAAFGEILTAKDWDTVEKIWQFINGYYEERSRVLERETGAPLGKVEAVPFTINGRKFDGGYYPIVYDPQLSQKASDMDVANELAKQMSSNAVFGAGLGATKKRQAVVNRELLLSLDVLPRAANEAILHISMREAVLDVAHLLDHATLAEPLQKVIGQSQYRMLREWVRDTWREELVRESSAEQFANLLRRNSTFAVMAYRTSTALLNICNIAMVAHSLGKVRTLQALLKFIRHPQRITRRVKEKSSFIAEREENLDRDLARDMKVSGKELSYVGTDGVAAKAAEGAYSAKEAVDRFGYWLITKTDLMFSLPTWQAVYEDTVRAEMERGELTAEQIDAEAVAKADEAVRRIWGSGEIQDQSKVQKGRIMKFFTPFYTFFSVVLNAHIEAGYALKDNGNPVPLMSTVLYWLFLQALLETALHGAIDAATGRGPDDDDDWVEYFGKEYLKNFVGTATGGIPGVNIAATLTMNTMLGEYYQGRGSQVVALRVMDELQDLAYAVGSDKRDWIDMGRSASRVGNRLVGFSDTLTDGFWTLLRVTCTESDATWDEAVADIIFDRKARKAK